MVLLDIISKLYKKHTTKNIKQTIIGNNIVQQNSINWSKRILGKQARTHINKKIRKQDLIAIDKLCIKPLKKIKDKSCLI